MFAVCKLKAVASWRAGSEHIQFENEICISVTLQTNVLISLTEAFARFRNTGRKRVVSSTAASSCVFPLVFLTNVSLLSELSCGSPHAGPQIFISDLAPVQCRGENRSRFPLISICLTVLSSPLLLARGCWRTASLPEDNETRFATQGIRYRATASPQLFHAPVSFFPFPGSVLLALIGPASRGDVPAVSPSPEGH